MTFNVPAIRAIYLFELHRTWRTLFQSIASPVISTSLYVIVFGTAIGPQMAAIDGVPYAAFVVPGLILLAVLTESVSNASFGIYLPRFTGTIYELLSAPISVGEVLLGYVGAAVTKSVLLGLIILGTARLFVTFSIAHPLAMLAFLVLVALGFCLLGFLLGLWADGFERLQIVPALVLTPLTFLGGTFYSVAALPPVWRAVTMLNPIVYLIEGFRWTFFGTASVHIGVSVFMALALICACLGAIVFIFRTGRRLRA
ncbi:ABC transporter permease [Ancylobacter sp. 6x-1]|uniref:Transport permease protein n=1 Tax=Ancylobacter crimeensis TaxID=2579147 RepID=A0ABT0DDQ2_9HYPH|nr:ABC transporter permease [Ancylobacter crimeensis]